MRLRDWEAASLAGTSQLLTMSQHVEPIQTSLNLSLLLNQEVTPSSSSSSEKTMDTSISPGNPVVWTVPSSSNCNIGGKRRRGVLEAIARKRDD